jgi:hypothetical protein
LEKADYSAEETTCAKMIVDNLTFTDPSQIQTESRPKTSRELPKSIKIKDENQNVGRHASVKVADFLKGCVVDSIL